MPLKTVSNTLTGLRKQGIAEATGEKDGRAEQVRFIVPASQPSRNGTWDAGRTKEHKADITRIVREGELMRRTGIIQSERQVFEMVREYFGLDKPEDVT